MRLPADRWLYWRVWLYNIVQKQKEKRDYSIQTIH